MRRDVVHECDLISQLVLLTLHPSSSVRAGMNRSAALRAVQQVAAPGNDPSWFIRLSSSCWRCHLSSLSAVTASSSLSPSYRLLHTSTAVHQSTATSSRSHRSERSEQLSRNWTDEHIDDDVESAAEVSWSPPPFRPAPPDMSDLMAVARTGASKSAMNSPLHQTLVALVENGDLATAVTHLRSFHRTATVDSWNVLLSALVQRKRHDHVAEMWRLWQSAIPPLSSPLHSQYNRLLLPNATTYCILLRSPSRLLTSTEALAELKARGLPASTFIYNTLIKEHVSVKDWASANAALDRMRSDGQQQDIFTMSLRFTLLNSQNRKLSAARKYEQISALWDDLHALQLPRIPISLGYAFVFYLCGANDVRRLVQLVHAIFDASGPADVVHMARPVEMMLGCLMRNDRLQEMIQLYGYMRRVGFKMMEKHFFVLVAGFARRGETNGMMRVFNEMVGHGVQPTLRLFETMLQAYGRAGDGEAALLMIRRMSEFGVQPTIDCVCAIMRGFSIRWNELSGRPDEPAEPSDTPTEGEQAASTTAPISSSMTPLSWEYLSLFELTDELNMTPSIYMFHRLLHALREERDVASTLFFLRDMKQKGLLVHLSSLHWVLWQLSELAQSPSAHVQLLVVQATLIVEGEEQSLSDAGWYYLLTMYIGVGDVASMQRVYRAIYDRGQRITWLAYLRMMQECLRADSSEVREHERMQFITQLYSHLRATPLVKGESIYNEVLQAYAVLGDTTGMKEVLAAMRRDGIAMGEATLAVLDEAREHVLYTADISNYITQQRNRITTLQMENNIRTRHRAELRLAAAAAAKQDDEPTRLAAIDAPAVKNDARSVFALPHWSPLYDPTEAEAEAERQEEAATAAAVEELQSALSVFLSSLPAPILHAQRFPALEATAVQQLDEAAAAGPTAKQLLAIGRELEAIKRTWHAGAEQQTKKREMNGRPGNAHTDHTETATDGAVDRSLTTRIQHIDAPPSASPAAPLSRPASKSPSSAVELSLGPQPGHIDLSARSGGSVKRVIRAGTIGRLPHFSLATTDTVTARRMKAALARKEEEERSKLTRAAAEPSAQPPRSPVLPLPLASTSAIFFRTMDSHADSAVIADSAKSKRRARKGISQVAAAAAVGESGTSGVAKVGRKQRSAYHGGWTDLLG